MKTATSFAVVLLLFVGGPAAFAGDASPSTEPSAQSVQPNSVGACCADAKGGTCSNGASDVTCFKQGGDYASDTKCAAGTCDRGTCCRVSSRQNDPPCTYGARGNSTYCLQQQCTQNNQFMPNGTVAFVFLKNTHSTAACSRLKGACCVEQASGRRVCKRLSYDQCRALDGFLKFSYGKTCAEAKCSSKSIGGCCIMPKDGEQPANFNQVCLLERTKAECTFWPNQDFAPTQACENVPAQFVNGTTCDHFTGACCHTNDAGSPTCDDTMTQGQCRALPGFIAFDYSKKCTQTDCTKFGACCDMDPLQQKQPPVCTPGRTEVTCVQRTYANSLIWIAGKPCSACKGQLFGACCTGSANGTTSCQSNVEYQTCIAKPGYLRFNLGKDCQKDAVNCNMYGACCVPEDQQSTSFICVGDKYYPYITQSECAKRGYIDGPNAPKALWRSGVPCPSFTKCPAAP